MTFLKQLSIRSKLIVILLSLTSLILILGFVVVITQEISVFRNELVENAITIARVIGDYSIVDLTFSDPKASRETLSKLNSIDHVTCARLYDTNGKLFSTYGSTDCYVDATLKMPMQFDEDFLHLSQPIQDQERKYGTIYMRFSLSRLNQKINRYLWMMVTLLVILVVLSYVLATQLQRLISRPLVELAGATKKISEDRDYSIRVHADSTDEVGVLFRGFNEMLDQLEKRKLERDRAEQALRESEHRYRVLVETSPVALFLEQDSRIVYANPSAYELTGCSNLSEMDELDLLSILRPGASKSVPQERIIRKQNGTQVDVGILCAETTHDGRPAVQYLVRDATESNQLRQAAQRMERLAAIGEFSAMLAHEIRNSVGSVALNARILSERMQVPDRLRKNLQNVELGVQRMQEIIKAILNFARPAIPRLQQVTVSKLIESSIHFVEEELEEKGVLIEREYLPSDLTMRADVDQISQVFVNLFHNASQAMENGGKIRVRAIDTADNVIVTVVDNGKGIPAENIDKIFNPFFTTTARGVGLGLAFVTRILEQHGAQINVESKVGEGTSFTILFPKSRRSDERHDVA